MLIGERYRLDRILGSGGFGRVWAARDETLQIGVAVKELFLSEDLAEADRKDLLLRAGREARNAAKLRDHPNIVSVHDVVTVDGAPWIVMQLVEGDTLHELLAKEKRRLSVEAVEVVAKALLHALDAAHQQGIVHRDIKPANVMVTSQSQILLTDFGIAVNKTDSKLTRTGLVIGSLSYLSPERAQGEKGGPAGDLFSLGTTLYEAVEGIAPFHRDNPAGTLHAVAFENTPPMRRAGRLEPLITALLQKDPADRPSICKALRLLDSPAKNEETTSETKGRSKATVSSTAFSGATTPAPSVRRTRAGLSIENKTQSRLGIFLNGEHTMIKPAATRTYDLDPGTCKIKVNIDGNVSPPCLRYLKADTTELVTVRRRGRYVRLESREDPPTWTHPVSNGREWLVPLGLITSFAVLLLLLYANHTSTANSVSEDLNGDISHAAVEDCVHHVSPDADTPEAGKWVEVPCWSAATKYIVNHRLASRDTLPGTTRLINPDKKTGCASHPYWARRAISLNVRPEGQIVHFEGPNAESWELCVSPHYND
ncbi:serine/threonine-protein kinase [Streptomyces sp. NPDC012794]|uniref:serine/threonine-protein kinase n=1 Tax=Streptomyces sp. NPDC012794 TaxID=3364850 RepID=UPI0036B9EB3A